MYGQGTRVTEGQKGEESAREGERQEGEGFRMGAGKGKEVGMDAGKRNG